MDIPVTVCASEVIPIQNRVALALAPYLSEHGFTMAYSTHWVRRTDEVVQHVFISERKSGSIRLEVFVQSLFAEDLVVGGVLTPSSIRPAGGHIGGDVAWPMTTPSDTVAEMRDTLDQVAMPFFDCLIVDAQLSALEERFPKSNYVIELEKRDKVLEDARVYRPKTTSLSLQRRDDIYDWLSSELEVPLSDIGFECIRGHQLSFVRSRGDVNDVIRLKAINYGLHFGGIAFNWLPGMALDGSSQYDEESAVVLNGGAISRDGQLTPAGSAFLAGSAISATNSAKRFCDLIEPAVVPRLERIDDWSSFKKSIPPALVGTAKRLAAIARLYEEDSGSQ